MLPSKSGLSRQQRQLLDCFASISSEDQQSLLSFAEFLLSRTPEVQQAAEAQRQPLDIPRPTEESVVAAMRRLSKTYHFLDTAPLLNEASVLMGAHLMQGKSAVEVIDQLQLLFEQAHTGTAEDSST